jgi:glucosylceramidase
MSGQGITINYVTPQNEPANSTTTYPGMWMTAADESTFISDLVQALNNSPYSTGVLGFDHNWDIPSFPKALVASKAPIAGLAWHCYGAPKAPSVNASSVMTAYRNLINFVTECSGTGPDSTVNADDTTNYSNFQFDLNWDSQDLIIGGLNDGASGIQLYNLALDGDCGPQLPYQALLPGGTEFTSGSCQSTPPAPDYAPCEDCRGIVTVNQSQSTWANNVDFYVLEQASWAFSYGAKEITSSSSSKNIFVTAAINQDGTTGAYIDNPGATTSAMIVDNGESISIQLAANSVTSLRWTN